MLEGKHNQLATAASAYLRSAQHQPVEWNEWGEAAFARAKAEGKPVLLDIGAVWCHWCHVMDRESYENPDIAALINDHFVAIKVDRDERPDVDTRYQAAVQSISGQGGWPLTAFLTPEGKPYFGGTYFPPEDRYGRPGLPRVLVSMAHAYRERRDEVDESADSVMQAIEFNESFAEGSAELNAGLLEKIITSMVNQFDARNGGFGAQPKFPHPAALDLLIDAATRPGSLAEPAHRAATVTLEKMAAGGIHDQLGGGFHRYSVDERWIVPHFEKMAYDNSALLRAYAHGFQSFLDPSLARVAADTKAWMDAVLSDQQRGGFYAAQDADVSLDDDGDFFTWTRAEAQAVLTPEEFDVAAARYNLRAVGDMHHNPAKNVLHVGANLPELAQRQGRSEEEVHALLASARSKLLAARAERPAPFVDRTLYTGWNGLCISAYLATARALGLPEAASFARKSMDRLLAEAWDGVTGLSRVVAYGDGERPATPIAAVLDDYGFVANAALDLWEVTGELRYVQVAAAMAEMLLERFLDHEGGGFFDTEQRGSGQSVKLGALGTRRKPIQDAPTPAGNAVAATLLLRLHSLTGNDVYRQRALETLQTFAGVAEHLGLHAASYGQALRRAIAEPVQVCVIGSDGLAEDLTVAATARFSLVRSVICLKPEQLDHLPLALASTLPFVPGVREGSVAVVCRGFVCLPPVRDPRALMELLRMEA